jgi:hypothetical protein
VTDHDVTDFDPLIKEMLDRQVPLRAGAHGEWGEVLRQVEGDVLEGVITEEWRTRESPDGRERRPRRRVTDWVATPVRKRRLLVVAFGLVVLAVAGAAGAGSGWLSGSSNAIDTSKATSLVQYTLTNDISLWKAGVRIAIWRLPQSGGGVCDFIALASPRPAAPGGVNPVGGGGFCSSSGDEVPSGKPARVFLHTTRQLGGSYSWLVDGAVSSGSDIVKLEVLSATGRFPLAYGNGWFLGQLPSSFSASELPQGGPYVLVGYDSQGKAIEHLDLLQVLRGSATQ